jgi:hypothetical protein
VGTFVNILEIIELDRSGGFKRGGHCGLIIAEEFSEFQALVKLMKQCDINCIIPPFFRRPASQRLPAQELS